MKPLHVYLVRHEEAEDGYDLPDAHRALTARGRARMRETGKLVLEHGDVDLVYTSPLVRAVQTAELLLAALGVDEPLFARDVVAHPSSLSALVRFIDQTPAQVRGVALVGHEPTLSELAATLLGIDAYPRPFKKGSVLCLAYHRDRAQRGETPASFKWLILAKGPELVRDLYA